MLTTILSTLLVFKSWVIKNYFYFKFLYSKITLWDIIRLILLSYIKKTKKTRIKNSTSCVIFKKMAYLSKVVYRQWVQIFNHVAKLQKWQQIWNPLILSPLFVPSFIKSKTGLLSLI